MDEQKTEGSDKELLITFRLGDETYGINIYKVREVIYFQDITLVSNLPEFVAGVICSWDQVIPVVDMRKRFGITEDDKSICRVVVLDLNDQQLGLIVDDIFDVLMLDASKYESPCEEMLTEYNKACITRMIRYGDEAIIIISPELILTSTEKSALKYF